jgi:hypothetical protein
MCWFEKVENQKMILSDFGKISEQYWLDIPIHQLIFKNNSNFFPKPFMKGETVHLLKIGMI